MIRRGIGVQSYVSAGVSTDADAQAFITAAGITDATQQSAINTLVTDLKGYGIWSKMKAIYPMVGGTSSTHKWNLKDPRDLDAAFRLVFSGGITHSSTGVLFNGTNGYGDSKLNASVSLTTPSHLSYYTGTNANTSTDQIDMGINQFWLSIWYNGSGFNNMLARNQSNTVLLDGGIISDSRGYAISTKVGTTSKLFFNNIQKDSKTDTFTGYSNLNIIIGAFYTSAGTINLFSNRDCRFASIGNGLTDTEAANLYTAVQAYQTTLSRNV